MPPYRECWRYRSIEGSTLGLSHEWILFCFFFASNSKVLMIHISTLFLLSMQTCLQHRVPHSSLNYSKLLTHLSRIYSRTLKNSQGAYLILTIIISTAAKLTFPFKDKNLGSIPSRKMSISNWWPALERSYKLPCKLTSMVSPSDTILYRHIWRCDDLTP